MLNLHALTSVAHFCLLFFFHFDLISQRNYIFDLGKKKLEIKFENGSDHKMEFLHLCSPKHGQHQQSDDLDRLGHHADVHLIPGLSENLISVRSLNEKGYCVTFTRQDGTVIY